MRRDQRLVHPKFQPYLDRFVRGSVTNSLRSDIARAARRKLTGRVAQRGGVVTVQYVRAKFTNGLETEVEKA